MREQRTAVQAIGTNTKLSILNNDAGHTISKIEEVPGEMLDGGQGKDTRIQREEHVAFMSNREGMVSGIRHHHNHAGTTTSPQGKELSPPHCEKTSPPSGEKIQMPRGEKIELTTGDEQAPRHGSNTTMQQGMRGAPPLGENHTPP